MFALDKLFWWQSANSVRIPLGIVLAIAWTLRLRSIYWGIKTTPKRSPRVRRIEVIAVISLWSFIALALLVLFLSGRFR